MCGRYTLFHAAEEIAQRFEVPQVLLPVTPRYNIAPSQPLAVVTQNGSRVLDAYRWGLVPFWAKDPQIGNRLINARAETLLEKPAFKNALKRRRCLIPADGFYEWKKEGQQRQPVRIGLSDDRLFAFAGLWEEWGAPDGSPLRTCTIITVAPNPLMASIHNRMPAMLQRADEAAWLDPSPTDGSRLLPLLRPYPETEMRARHVSRSVNSPAYDAPDCLESIEGTN